MKKMSVLILVLAFMLVLTGCCFHGEWYAATCTDPKTCVECGETEGEALGHTWTEADCTTAKTCQTCHLTEGDALGHAWKDATTEPPKTCATCGETEGERIITDERFTTAATADLQGKWTSQLDLPSEMLGVEGFEMPLTIGVSIEFGNDGTMKMGYAIVNEEEFNKGMTEFLIQSMYAEMAAQGFDEESTDELMLQTYDMTTAEFAESAVTEMNLSAVFEAMSITGVYYVEGDQLYTGISWDMEMGASAITLEGDKLTMAEELSGLSEEAMVFTREAK